MFGFLLQRNKATILVFTINCFFINHKKIKNKKKLLLGCFVVKTNL